jgi:hypothetical protein
MDNLLLNSLNKKILLIATVLLLLGFTTQAYRYNPNNNHKVYMHEAETKASEYLSENEKIQYDGGLEIQFLPLDEVENVLKRKEYEALYIQTDPNFYKKVENIERYMTKRNAPLGSEAEYIVTMANKFEIDYRLLPAISIIESSGGLKLYRKYNAWGWGGAKGFTFENWEHSIYVVSRGMAGYYLLGLDTPEKMAPRYNPHTPNEWSGKVRMVMNQIGPEL